MPLTSRLALPYPSLTDAPNAPAQLQSLVTTLEALRADGHVGLAADYSFTSDGFVYMVPFASVFLNGLTQPSGYRLAVPKAGTYRVTAQARITRGSASATAYTMQLRKNSADSSSGGGTVLGAWGTGAVDATLVSSLPLVLAAGDYLQMFVTGLNGSTLKAGNFATYIAAKFEPF